METPSIADSASTSKLNDAAARDFANRLLVRLRTLPGVEAAAIASQVPLDIHGLSLRGFTLEGRARSDAAPDRALSNIVTRDYFRTMGIPLRSGQDFAAFDDPAAPAQAIVNEETNPATGALHNDSAASTLARSLSTLTLTNLVTGVPTGAPKTLAEIGVATNRDGTLSVDATKLSAAMLRLTLDTSQAAAREEALGPELLELRSRGVRVEIVVGDVARRESVTQAL